MANAETSGHVLNLDDEQTKVLRRYWSKLLRDLEAADEQAIQNAADSSKGVQQKRTSIFSFSRRESTPTHPTSSKSLISNQPPVASTLFETWWLSIGFDHPDSLPLRFIRARKWDIEKSVAMTVNSIVWRKDFGVLDLIKVGESALDAEEIRLGKVYFHKPDKEGRPVAIIHVRLHDKYTVNQELTQRFTTLIMEDGRQIMKIPVETATLVFDLTGFSTANGDLPFTKFLLSTLEAHYPECLGTVLILNAPWIFQGFWALLRPLLDPVVASKVHFVNTEDLPKFIDPENIPSTLDPKNGKEFNFQFIEPSEEEIAEAKRLSEDIEGYENARKQFFLAAENFKEKTIAWAAPEFCEDEKDEEEVELEGQQTLKQDLKDRDIFVTKVRTAAAVDMVDAYARLAPYIRAKTHNNRSGLIVQETVPWTSHKNPNV